MKATLTIEYDPEVGSEVSLVRTMQDGAKIKSVLWDLDQWLRGKLKYEEPSEEAGDFYEEVRSKLRELCSEENVDIWSE